MAKAIFYLKRSSLEGRHHPSRYDHESTRRKCFLILKLLNSDSLQRRLQKSIKFLSSFKNPKSSSGCMPGEEDILRTLNVLQSTYP